MPVVQLFGPPEPEAKSVVGTADAINYFPKLNQAGQLLWEQRPGLTPVLLAGVPGIILTQVVVQVLMHPAIVLQDVNLTQVTVQVLLQVGD